MNNVHYSSKTVEWETPQWFFDSLNEEFRFTLDAAANHTNRKCEKYLTEDQNGLDADWHGTVWLNPPYGREIGKWVDKAMLEAEKGATVVCLIPAKTETRWWAKFWDYEKHRPVEGCEVRFIFKRLQFGNSGINAPFPCAVVIFRSHPGLDSTSDEQL